MPACNLALQKTSFIIMSDAEDNLFSNNSNRADEEGMQISKKEEEETAPVVDYEGNVKIFEENATDEETVNANDSDTDHEDKKCVLSSKSD